MPEETFHMQIGKELEQIRRKITDNKPNDRSDADLETVINSLRQEEAKWRLSGSE
jgi:hypothetical protein